MKTFRFLGFVLSAILLCLSACSKGEDDPITPPTPKPEDSTPTITLDSSIQTSGLSFEASASEKSISFTTNSDWTLSIAEARSGTDWCKASPTSGGKGTANVKFTATENTEHEDRSVTVTIKAGTTSKTFTISQKGKEEMLIPYLTFTADSTQTLTMSKAVATLEYSVNGEEWKELGTNVVSFGGNLGNLQLRGQNPEGTAKHYLDDYSTIKFGNDYPVNCFGDIRTLVDYENYATANTKSAKFCSLFSKCSNLISSPELPATTLASHCYDNMFNRCKSLTNAPELPATTLVQNCYYHMFSHCKSLINTPELPVKTLANNCYWGMFSYCTSLTKTPELPATTLAISCYRSMFEGCSSLNCVTMLATDISAEYCLSSWLWGVSKTGEFIKHKDMKSLPSGINGIPEGWEVKDYIEE